MPESTEKAEPLHSKRSKDIFPPRKYPFLTRINLLVGTAFWLIRAVCIYAYAWHVGIDLGGPNVDASAMVWIPFIVIDLPWSLLLDAIRFQSNEATLFVYATMIGLPWIFYGALSAWIVSWWGRNVENFGLLPPREQDTHTNPKMRFSLRSALIAIAIVAAACVAITSWLRSDTIYNMDHGHKFGGWEYAMAKSCHVLRGPDIPTFVFGDGHSKSIPYLESGNLPFVILLKGEGDRPADVYSTVQLDNQPNLTAATTIEHGLLIFDIVYQLRTSYENGNEPEITERFLIDGQEHNLTEGRVFAFNLRETSRRIEQIDFKPFPRSMIPEYQENSRKQVRSILRWWRELKSETTND